jgi:AcrR family transcriptional regulator
MPFGKISANWHYGYTFMMPAGLRERNKLRRHEQITEAALRLFAERGFEGTTIDEIAAAADVSRRTFFRYFARKEDVIVDWKRRTADELRDALDARPPGEAPLEAVHRALATVAAGYGEQPELALGLMRVFESGPDLRAGADYPAWDAVLTDGVARRAGVDPLRDPMPRLVVTVGFAVFSATVQSWAESGGSGHLLAQLDEGFAALRGVVLDA